MSARRRTRCSGNYTDVAEAERFVKETGVSALAVMVGTAHGRYKKRLCWIFSVSATSVKQQANCRWCSTAAPVCQTNRSAWQ